jgi:putative tricarboxylic transport membrane protein
MTRRRIQAPQDFVAGTSLVLIALFALWAARDLVGGRLGAPGPGMVPRVLALGVLLSGTALVIGSLVRRGEALARWALRGPFFICLSVLAFALTIRTPGLAVAGPLVVLVSGAASPETRWRELALFSVGITVVCILLFRTLLRLPIPVLVIPGVATF